jgi:hypothetical protein
MPPHQPRRQRRRSTRTPQARTIAPRSVSSTRREQAAAEAIDYSEDYASVRRDLKYIALWSSLLLAGMLAMYFVM